MNTAEPSDEVMHIFYTLHFYDNFYTFILDKDKSRFRSSAIMS